MTLKPGCFLNLYSLLNGVQIFKIPGAYTPALGGMKWIMNLTASLRKMIRHFFSNFQREKIGYLEPPELDCSMDCLLKRQKELPPNEVHAVFDHIWRGGFADVQEASAEMAQLYYQSYMENYLIADAVNDEGIIDIAG